ncbi:trypsin-like peptidase domain-containing protein [Olsenella sp. DSM 107455]|uniref:Trypsin-like peptidase domain-containing protein n=1 Tax=Thermophilibacter gallinarum TaxID=2779357 RepID=A0ABR9QRV8_9ACTN|nr:trypsin-like peptidase domain-containing protein [Thermophilibacter gallinarum]MBE5023812.1 trypsin-like peptidase domain-containing protein [Thermophilibacter gallinarum]
MSEYPDYGAPEPEGLRRRTEENDEQDAQARTEARPPAPGHPAPPDFDHDPAPKHEKGRKPRTGLKALLMGLLGGVLGAGLLAGTLFATGVVGTADTQIVSTDGTQQITIDPSDEDTTTANAVAAKALPSVATIYCTFAEGEGMGSGVIYDTDGNIITNNHVVEDAESISVAYNGKSYDATLVGTDPSSDVAVIHVDFGDDEVTPMEVGDSSALQVGDWVMSVGSPFGLENSVSQGIVSALSRSTLLSGASGNTLYTNLIQTDATINPGNSGGALVNDRGQLVGICTLFSSDTESFAGIGYAIPSDYATQVADKIIAGETVTHAYIGLSMQTVTPSNALSNGLAVDEGAYVVEVTEGGPAAEAGIQVGDVITSIGGETIGSADGAILAVRSHEIGDTVEVTVMRGDQERTFEVTLGSDEALQEQQEEETVTVNGQEISVDDLIRLYEQYQQQRNNPFGR